MNRRSPHLADVVALAAAMERDELRPQDEITARDLRIGAAMPAAGYDGVATSLAWLDAVCERDRALEALRHRVATVVHGSGILVATLGVIVGWLAAFGVFYYDGNSRVNAIAVLAILVLVPALFLVPFVLATLPPRILAWLPGATAAAALARGLSPGRLGMLVARLLPRDGRAAIERFFAGAGKMHALYAGIQKWTILRWSQMFALGFQAAALTATLALVVFTDLVFGWSTTLGSADATELHRVVSWLAAPWSWALDGAAPSLELIRESRYFRVVTAPVSVEQAARLGAWWSFLVMAMFVYGFLPRMLSLGIAHRCSRAALGAACATMPGISSVVRRLHAGRVQTTAGGTELDAGAASPPVATDAARTFSAAAPVYAAFVNWADVVLDDNLLREKLGDGPVYRAGGAATLAEDELVVQRLRETCASGDESIAIIVKAWEPPLMEFVDFLQALREALGRGREIVVMPLAMDETGAEIENAAAQIDVWRRKLARVGDPWLRLAEVPS